MRRIGLGLKGPTTFVHPLKPLEGYLWGHVWKITNLNPAENIELI
jgi:hypothetical protein